MAKKYDALTKSKITSGLQCHKKLWFDIHQPIRENKAAFKRRNILGSTEALRLYFKAGGSHTGPVPRRHTGQPKGGCQWPGGPSHAASNTSRRSRPSCQAGS